jgi:hypothetical protein
MLTEEQTSALVLATVKTMGKATPQQLDRVVEWADRAMIEAAILSLVFRGTAGLSVDDKGEIHVHPAEERMQALREMYEAEG